MASGQQTKPPTRSSIRHSLILPSVAKAFVDVINKDSKEDKTVRRRDSARLSAIHLKTNPPRPSVDLKTAQKSAATPESKTITRHSRRVSAVAAKSSSDELADSNPKSGPPLRPRPATSSGLPKYRPKSVLIQEDTKKPPSPVRVGVRRRLSFSEDEKDVPKAQTEAEMTESLAEKATRPISPLPQRAALKINLTNAVNSTPKTPPTSLKSNTPSSTKHSSARPMKVVKTTPNAAIPRPSSSSSSSSSLTPRTPKTPNAKRPVAIKNSPATGLSCVDDSPLSRLSKKMTKAGANNGNMTLISEGDSDGDEAEDVARLLAPVAALGAPTPAMPRLEHRRTRAAARSPTEPSLVDSESPSTLRVNPSPSNGAPRGSILSFEQLANTSQTLREEDIQTMLSEVTAPFHSDASSPQPRHSVLLSVPESPCISAMNSPGGYSSISQILLPDVTPSPAIHPKQSRTSEVPVVDAAIVTLLRLQLSSAEGLAKDRLNQIQAMEEENHNLRARHKQDVNELSRQIGILEEQIRGNLQARERTEEDQAAHVASLQDQLRQAEVSRDQAVEGAVAEALKGAETARRTAMRMQTLKWDRVNVASETGRQWWLVSALASSELQTVKGDREILSLFMSELDMLES